MAKPVDFKFSNNYLGPPRRADGSAVPDVIGMHTWTDGQQSVSRWQLTWRERVQAMWHGHVWLGVLSGESQPPVYVATDKELLKEGPAS